MNETKREGRRVTVEVPYWQELAEWSEWIEFTPKAVRRAPATPGVYVFRSRVDFGIVYVGMAGERNGKGLRGRLGMYMRGRAPHSGLGSLCLERALADPDWLGARVKAVRAGAQWTVYDWARAAVERAALEVRWASTDSREGALELEKRLLVLLGDQGLWNRAL